MNGDGYSRRHRRGADTTTTARRTRGGRTSTRLGLGALRASPPGPRRATRPTRCFGCSVAHGGGRERRRLLRRHRRRAALRQRPDGRGAGLRLPRLGLGPRATAAWTAESDQAGADFGCSVATAGDVNGDGYTDVIVGAPRYDNGQTNEGRAYVYLGSALGAGHWRPPGRRRATRPAPTSARPWRRRGT